MKWKTFKSCHSQKGVALIMVLWVMVLMAAMATEFSYSMRIEVISTRNFKEELESDFLAESGIDLAIAEIMEDSDFHSVNEEGQFIFGHIKKEEEAEGGEESEEETAPEAPSRKDIPLGAGTISYRIVDDNRKININSVAEKRAKKILKKILKESKVNDEMVRSIISDSIIDWIDKNDLHELNGAEDEYYQNLEEPYSCKNAPIDTLEEMLRIKGITQEIFYGTDYAAKYDPDYEKGPVEEEEKLPGLYSLLTVQKTGIVNPNTASSEVLRVFYPAEVVDRILAKRAEEGRFDTTKSTHFTVYSLGEIKESGIKHLIVASIQLAKKDKKPVITITYWNHNEDPKKYYDLLDESS